MFIDVYISLGCNIISKNSHKGSKKASLDAYFDSILNALPLKILTQSRTYTTEAFPKGSGPDFRNNVIKISTELAPEDLLKSLHDVENAFDRERPYRWSPRTCDLDLLFYGDLISPDLATWQSWHDLSLQEAQKRTPDTLLCPHPRLHERAFVLGPLCDIAPDLIHPVLNESIKSLWNALPESDKATIKAVDPHQNT